MLLVLLRVLEQEQELLLPALERALELVLLLPLMECNL